MKIPNSSKRQEPVTGKRLLTALVGGLIGLIPILLMLTAGQVLDGLDVSSPTLYLLPGLVLVSGVIVGAALGWRMHHRFVDHTTAVAVTGLATVFVIVGWQIALLDSEDERFHPIHDSRDCREVYELLGATEILDLPDDLSPNEIDGLEEKLAEFEKQSPNDPVCHRLREDLEAQQ